MTACMLSLPGAIPAADHSTDDSTRFLTKKMARVRPSTVGSLSPDMTHQFVPETLLAFVPVTVEEVMLRLKKATAEHCILDAVHIHG